MPTRLSISRTVFPVYASDTNLRGSCTVRVVNRESRATEKTGQCPADRAEKTGTPDHLALLLVRQIFLKAPPTGHRFL